MSQTAGVNYVHYGHATDSGSIEVNQLQQIKGGWRSHRPLLPQSSDAQWGKKTHVLSQLSEDCYDEQGEGHMTDRRALPLLS